MYSMILDSVRERNADNQIMAEVSLMRSALRGNPAVLTPNQAMDSIAVQEIVLGNNKNGAQKNSFCAAVRLGIVQIAIPSGYRDLIDCCQETLRRGIVDPKSEFVISGLRFLYERNDAGEEAYPFVRRQELTKCIVARLSETKRRIKTSWPEWLTDQEQELVEGYVDSISLLNDSIEEYASFTSYKNLLPRILEKRIARRLLAGPYDSPLSGLLKVLLKECGRADAPVFRSYYYRIISERSRDFDPEAIGEARTIVDIAYNIVAAMSVRPANNLGNTNALTDGSEVELNISEQFTDLTDSLVQEERTDCAFKSGYTVEDAASVLDWEMIVWLYQEILAIQEAQGLNYWEALECLYAREQRLPFELSGKYMLVTGIKVAVSSLIPGIRAVEFLTEYVKNEVESAVSKEQMGPSSFREINLRASTSKKALKVLDTLIYSH